MWEPIPGENFEPSVSTKNIWTFTRKSPYNVEGMRLPGLFTTSRFDTEAVAFALVCILEIWGLYSLVSSFGLFDVTGAFNTWGVGGVVAAFLLDLFLATVRHLPVGADCRYRNRRVIATTPQELARLEHERGSWRWLSPICAVLILILAGVKIWLFYKLNEDVGITGLTASVLVSYFFAALLHIFCTGYFLSAWYFRTFCIGSDHKTWANDGPTAQELQIHDWRPFPIEIPTGETVRINEKARAHEHYIRRGNIEDGEATYVLETWGVLTDRDLQSLIVNQPTANAKTTLARVCLQAQLLILDAPPLAANVHERDQPVPELKPRAGTWPPIDPNDRKEDSVN